MTTATTPDLLLWFDNRVLLDAIITLLYVSAAWHLFFPPPSLCIIIEVEVLTSIKTHKENEHNDLEKLQKPSQCGYKTSNRNSRKESF